MNPVGPRDRSGSLAGGEVLWLEKGKAQETRRTLFSFGK